MRETIGNIWDFHACGHWIAITTNGNVKANGEAVMGKGIALEAKERIPNLPYELARKINKFGLHVYPLGYNIVAFPTKYNWRERSSLGLILRSCIELVYYLDCADLSKVTPPVYLPRPGCSSGGLDWKDVRSILEKCLDDRFIVVERGVHYNVKGTRQPKAPD